MPQYVLFVYPVKIYLDTFRWGLDSHSNMTSLSVIQSGRPRNVNALQAAAILYGDWGTSKAYVIGLAFALASYSSFWLILGVSILNILVGLNYTIICKYYPHGGGVYASVRHRSEILALVGGFFLICDYIVTASLSALSAFSYLGVGYPQIWAGLGIVGIGLLNFFGPRNTGNLAFVITIFALIIVAILGVFSLFHLDEAIKNLQPLSGGIEANWVNFVGVIVALSGIEAIANMTGVMKLDKGSNRSAPTVVQTSTPAIVAVMLEVSIFTALFSLAINALPGLVVHDSMVAAPGNPNVRDSMLRYMGEVFCSSVFSQPLCELFGYLISFVFAILLLSSVNTAIIALNSLLFVLSRDKQLPHIFSKTNRYGVPKVSLVVAIIAPVIVLFAAHDMTKLASLYAAGFVGAIATNLGSTSTDKTLSLKKYERVIMFITFLVMVAIEITIFYDKEGARTFIMSTVAIGLILRALVLEKREGKGKKLPERKEVHKEPLSVEPILTDQESADALHVHAGAVLCAVTHISKGLEYALKECQQTKRKLFILFVREQKVLQQDLDQHWVEDKDACEVFDYVIQFQKESDLVFLYDTSDMPALNIVKHARELQVSALIMGMTRKSKILELIRGNIVTEVFKRLPKDIDLIIVS